MAECLTGLATRLLAINEKAVFVHCHGHRLNLALCAAANKMKCVRDTISTVENVCVIVEQSAKRHALFQFIQNEKGRALALKLHRDTRWGSHSGSSLAISKTLSHVKTFLEIVSDEDKTSAGATASGLLRSISKFIFVFVSRVLNNLFLITNRLNEYLS
jgi:hypothetical protein